MDSASKNTIGGLRRINLNLGKGSSDVVVVGGPTALDDSNSSIYYSNNSMATLNIIEEQKQQLFGICEVIQSKIRAVLEKIAKVVNWVETNTGKPQSWLMEYEQSIWPLVIEIDAQIKLLSQTVRHTIDSCNINDQNRLGWLLAINKFQVNMEKMVSQLVDGPINMDIERVLRVRVRGEIYGLKIRDETMKAIRAMQKELRARNF